MQKIINFFLYIFGCSKHKVFVAFYMSKIAFKIFYIGLMHDNSKFTILEMKGFMSIIHKLSNVTYGTKEYKAYLQQIKPSVDLHYKRNSHHAEYYKNGFSDMSFFDLCEMYSDWKAAIKRHKDGDINRSFIINKDRYNMPDNIIKLLKSIDAK